MADVNKTVAIIFQGQDNASATAGNLASNLESIGSSAGTAASKVDALGKETDQLGEKGQAVDRLADSLKALATGLVVKAFIDANVEAERFERSMTLLKGSTDAAQQEFEYIKTTTNALGISLFEAADAYVSLTAATKGTALEGQATRDIFEAVSKAMSALGKSGADTQGALLAISQIVSKGTVSLEELRGQLGERLPGAFQIAARSMGLTTSELDKLVSSGKLTAEEFLPKFAAALNDTFGDAVVGGYAASLARLQNAVALAFVQIGDTGVFDAFTKGVQLATTAVVGAVSGFRLLGEIVGAVAGALATGNFSGLGDALDAAFQKAGESTRGARDALLGFNDEVAETSSKTSKASEDVNLFAGDVKKYETAQTAAAEATKKASESSKAAVDALAKEAAARAKAEEAAQKYALELEKLASNERIKTLEFKAEIDVAQIQADAEKVIAAFDSINTSITSTGDVLGELFGLFNSLGSLDSSARNALFAQIDKENTLRQQSFELQQKLTEAQIANINAQTKNLQSGDALIKIDGAGLQPHLEAFMWEILKSIQVRVNRDGGAFLLGL
jgi:tape measure domain-containing protein